MNKGELIKAMAEKAGFTNKDASIAYEAFVEVVTDALKAGEKVQLVGFGTFEVKEVAEKVAALIEAAGLEPIVKNKGMIMKTVMGELKGKADGKVIGAAVDALLK